MAADLSYQQIVMHRRDGNEYVPSGKNITVETGGYILHSVGTAAAAGSVIGDATALTAEINVVSGADGTKGVALPVAQAGMVIYIKGTTSAVLKVWPGDASTAINAGSAAAAFSMASGVLPQAFLATSATQWYSFPLLAS